MVLFFGAVLVKNAHRMGVGSALNGEINKTEQE